MVRRKILTLVVMSLSVVMLLGVFAVSAAGNYGDKEYYFSFKTSSESVYTSPTQKLDNTSSYIKCTYCTAGYLYTVSAYGLKTQNVKDGRYDCSGGHRYVVRNGSIYYIINYIYENGYSYGCLRLNPNSIGFDTYGKWSPDSI